jgi:acyl-[acyl-carrier-protein]-phospholipid O-acyltransferase / long-chain-fatty-acid--[acyl-carrier-protein] ligase
MLKLLRRRSFGAMTLSQFLGAFNDNAFKQVVVLLATAATSAHGADWVAGHPLGGALPGWLSPQALPPFLFSLPFVVFGPITGSLADRLSKSRIIKLANLLEIVVMALATVAFALEDYGVLLASVFLMGSQSALFGPSKYGCIKELVGDRDLSRANALIQASTMIAVLAGVFLGGIFRDRLDQALWIAGLWYIGFATLGWLVSTRIEALPAADPARKVSWNPVKELRSHWRATEGQRYLVLAIIASSFFYLMAATFLIVVPTYGHWRGLTGSGTSALMAMPGLGIIVGATVAGRISGDRIEGGLVPLGLLGMAGCLIATVFAPESTSWIGVCLFGMGIASGLFSIPVRCLIQSLPREEKRGAVQGLAEVMDFIGILLATPLFILWDKGLALTPAQMFVVGGVMLGLFAIVAVVVAGEFLVRLILLALTHTLYKLRVVGREEHLPREGGVLLVANHVSFVDAILVAAAAGRPVRFLMHRDYFKVPVVGWFARRMGVIGVAGGDGRQAVEQALDGAALSCRNGEAVCIFAEGAITRTGTMLAFRRGMERIASEAGVPVVPVALDRLWGSVFSFSGGRFFWKMPRRIPYPVDVLFGAPLPSETPAPVVRDAVTELISDHRSGRGGPRGSLAWRYLRAAKAHGRRPALVDSTGARMNHRQLLVAVLALRRALGRGLDPDERTVAILLPAGRASTLTNLALTVGGRITVNLNGTLSNAALRGPLARTGARRLVTSSRFLRHLERESPLPEGTLLIEDLLAGITRADKLRAFLCASLPGPLLARLLAPRVESRREVATVLFSSGSSGEPKGVELTHGAVLSNVQSLLQVFPLGPGDTLLGVLPHFHSFGYTVTLWGALLGGARVAGHASPLDAEAIGKLCQDEGVTVLVAAPTFYQAWLRRVPPEAFASVRVAASGAEKLRPELATAFEQRYGVPLIEGYGCTECGPVVAFNLPDAPGVPARERAYRPGTVGRPLPGVTVRVVDPDSGEVRPVGEAGLLQVKSPALMRGYLGDPELTAEVLQNGWYSTGDVARIDEDGFLILTDRLARFSKIGGEMVPHGRVEQELRTALDKLAPGSDAELAVTARPDDRKGERLVVVHTPLPLRVEDLLEELGRGELPALFRPRAADFVEVQGLPVLGTGKLDLRALRELGRQG